MLVDCANLNNHYLRNIDEYEVVLQFVYLASLITNNGDIKSEMLRRSEIIKVAIRKMYKIWRDDHISKQTKVRLARTLIFPIFIYNSETWTISKTNRRNIDALEMYVWRRILRISWTARKTNVSIFEKLDIRERLSTIINRKKLTYFGHIARRDKDSLGRLVMQGEIRG